MEQLQGGRHVRWGLCCILSSSLTLVRETLTSLNSTVARGGWGHWRITPRGALCLNQTASQIPYYDCSYNCIPILIPAGNLQRSGQCLCQPLTRLFPERWGYFSPLCLAHSAVSVPAIAPCSHRLLVPGHPPQRPQLASVIDNHGILHQLVGNGADKFGSSPFGDQSPFQHAGQPHECGSPRYLARARAGSIIVRCRGTFQGDGGGDAIRKQPSSSQGDAR